MNVLNQPVLCLNNSWLPIGSKTVKDAIVAMLGGMGGHNPPALAIDQAFDVDENGDPVWDKMTYAQPVTWAEWVNLPVRPFDLAVHSSNLVIRAPRVIIQPNFSKMPMLNPRPTKAAIFKRDGGVCQYTGKALTRAEANIDHVIPRAHGGKNTFDNMVLSHKDVNSAKADRTPEQAGLKLIRKPKAPPSIPVSTAIRVAHHPCWVPFLHSVDQVKGL